MPGSRVLLLGQQRAVPRGAPCRLQTPCSGRSLRVSPPAPRARPCPESRSWFLGSLTRHDREDVAEVPAPARRPSRAVRSAQPPCCTPAPGCAHAAGVLCGLTAGPTAPVAVGTAPGECRDVGVASRLGVPGDEATPGCEPPAVHQLCWPASGAAKFCCSKTPNCSQTRAGPAPRAAGWGVLPSPPHAGRLLPLSSSSRPSPTSRLWGCRGTSSCSALRSRLCPAPQGGWAPRVLFFQALSPPSRAVHMQITLLRSSGSCRSAEIPDAKRGHSHPPGCQHQGLFPRTFPTIALRFAQARRPHRPRAVRVPQLALLLSLLRNRGCHHH